MPKKLPASVLTLLKFAILIAVVAALHFRVQEHEQTWGQIAQTWWELLTTGNVALMVVAHVLIPVNWGLEAEKWRLLIARVEKLSFWQSFVGVLSGLSFGLLTPRHVGDYFGRILQLESQDRTRVVGALALSRLTQLAVTLLMGGIGLGMYYRWGLLPTHLIGSGFYLYLAVMFVFFVLFFLFRAPFFKWLEDKRFGNRVLRLYRIIGEYDGRTLFKVSLCSLIRYLVFSLQFVLVCHYVQVEVPFVWLFMGITLVFLFKSVVPSFNFLSDLGIREYFAPIFLLPLGLELPQALAATFTLWLLNILLPSMVGVLFTLRIKLKPNS